MANFILFCVLILAYVAARPFCDKTKMPKEMGDWDSNSIHIDSAVVENQPVTLREGQTYIYENVFPGYNITYVYVDNLAMKTCGGSATIKAGGVGTSGILILIHADPYQEIRAVVEIWGVKNGEVNAPLPQFLKHQNHATLFKDLKIINHNRFFVHERSQTTQRYDSNE